MNTFSTSINVLVVDDDDDIHYLVREYLEERNDIVLQAPVRSLADAIRSISHHPPDVILLDLSILDSRGLDTLVRLKEKVSDVPIVIMTSLDDEAVALEAVKKGAQDYLVKGHINSRMLIQVLRYAIERFHHHERDRDPDLVDHLTGLHNRKGFELLADQYMRTARRNPQGMTIYLLGIKNFDEILTKHGAAESHRAIKVASEILKENFRSSDIISHWELPYFAILPSVSTPLFSNAIRHRIRNSQTYYNSQFNLYRISLLWQPLHFAVDEQTRIAEVMTSIEQAFAGLQESLSFSIS